MQIMQKPAVLMRNPDISYLGSFDVEAWTLEFGALRVNKDNKDIFKVNSIASKGELENMIIINKQHTNSRLGLQEFYMNKRD